MDLLGRDDDLRRLRALIDTHPRVVVTGMPGVGRHSLVEMLQPELRDGHELSVAFAPDPVHDDAVAFRLDPLAPEPSRALFERVFEAAGGTQADDVAIDALLRASDGFPLVIQLAARLYASRSEAPALMREAPLWVLLPHDERAGRWRDALRRSWQASSDDVRGHLRALALFVFDFDIEFVTPFQEN